ncbi:MAG: CoA-binding protein [Bacteroidota bacterium]
MKKTVVLGASLKPERASNQAVHRLQKDGHEVIALGFREGTIDQVTIVTEWEHYKEVDTLTLYLNPQRQATYYDYILTMNPKRIIFNPGTENPELVQKAKAQGIEIEIACTLVLLSVDAY